MAGARGHADLWPGAHRGRRQGIEGGISGESQNPGETIYAEVDDPQKYLDLAESLGGKVVMPVTDMGMVTYGLFTDPEGHLVGVVKAEEATS